MKVLEKLTDHAADAVLSHGSFRNNHQVGLNAPLSQVVTSISTVPWFQIELSMKTLHGTLWDVDPTGSHIPTSKTLVSCTKKAFSNKK